MITKYVDQKCAAYRLMNATRKNSNNLISLSEIYDTLPRTQRYAVALDTFDYMFVESGSFATWYNSDYARIIMRELEALFSEVVEWTNHISQLRTVCAVERAIDSSVALLQKVTHEVGDVLVIDYLQQFNSAYLDRRSEFLVIMSQWFEAQS